MDLSEITWRCPDTPYGDCGVFVMGSPIMDRAESWLKGRTGRRAELFDTPIEKSEWKLTRYIITRLDKHGQLSDSHRFGKAKKEYHSA